MKEEEKGKNWRVGTKIEGTKHRAKIKEKGKQKKWGLVTKND
jgi:hypothetical protein